MWLYILERFKDYCDNHRNRPYHRRGTIPLWYFTISLLTEKNCNQYIAWLGRGLEFKLIDPEEVARRWGIQKNRPAMNYDKLSRSLRHYYENGIMQKVAGEWYGYRFVCNLEALFSLAFPDGLVPMIKPHCGFKIGITPSGKARSTTTCYRPTVTCWNS